MVALGRRLVLSAKEFRPTSCAQGLIPQTCDPPGRHSRSSRGGAQKWC